MPKHPGMMSGDTGKETHDEQNILVLTLKIIKKKNGEVILTYRFIVVILRNTKISLREDPKEGDFMPTVQHRHRDYSSIFSSTAVTSMESTMSSFCILS